MGKLFISHSSQDDGFVRTLQQALGELHQEVWIDSRQLRGGDPLETDINKAIDAADAYAVLVSPDALQSSWVGKELRHALLSQERRGKDRFPVIPLALNQTQLGVLEQFFPEEPVYIPASSQPGGAEAALNAILVALKKRLSADAEPLPQPQPEPLDDLVLELSDLKLYREEGLYRAQAKARLVYEPATPGQREVASAKAWRFIAPLGPIEADELRWYLEKYAIWPSRHFAARKATLEQNLIAWGQALYQAALPAEHSAKVLQAWASIDRHANRRFSVYVNNDLEAGADAAVERQAQEAATLLLGLPWELLHDGGSFLFQGAKPVRVRRRLPNTEAQEVPVTDPPIRVLLVTARPEDEACGYIDHRASALPLVQAMEALGGLVDIQWLDPPTLPALSAELARAQAARQPYHVLHFDGHGVYNQQVGLGGLCFEDPQDADQLERRRHQTVYTDKLGPLLKDHRIPLVFLEACQTAQADSASESVASELLKGGVVSVVAMSHSVLVETARRFVEQFYRALAQGQRVGEAMLQGQRALKDDSFRGRVFGAGELRLEDWFVPVLFQEKDDPQLFRALPQRQTQADILQSQRNRLGRTPAAPATGFVGRSRELLALQRLLLPSPVPGEGLGVRGAAYAVIRGQGGEGKTTLACEFARWLVRAQQIRRAVFVSVEQHSTAAAVLDAIGQQLVSGYSVAGYEDLEQALLPVEQALKEQSVLLILDNMESLLPPPYLAAMQAQAWTDEARAELAEILGLCARLLSPSPQPLSRWERGFAPPSAFGRGAGGEGFTRLLFTSREALPAPFDGERNRRELHQLAQDDAVKLVERVLQGAGQSPLTPVWQSGEAESSRDGELDSADAQTEAIERLVEAVHGHARTLALLAPSLRKLGVERTRQDLLALMRDMDRQYPPGSPQAREKSVYASVELSLRRLSPDNRRRARVLGLFHGGVDLDVLQAMMAPDKPSLRQKLGRLFAAEKTLSWEPADIVSLAEDLIATGLATADPYNHLSLNPALCPCVRDGLTAAERADWSARWRQAMAAYVEFLIQQARTKADVAAVLTGLELPNLLALLQQLASAGEAEATIALATDLFRLLQNLGKPRLLRQVGEIRDAAAQTLNSGWSHARFEALRTRIEQQLASGALPEAQAGAQALWQQARTAGGQAYPDADYDLAMAGLLLARVLQMGGAAEAALPLLHEARQRFEAFEQQQPGRGAERMASVCLSESGDCLSDLGRLDAAAAAHEEAIRRAEQRGAERDVAVGQIQLGTVRLWQRRYPEALQAYELARERFQQLDEPGSLATAWHQTGVAYQYAGQPEAAEDAYRQSLAIKVRLGDIAGQASTLNQLGNLYDAAWGRTEEAVSFLRQAAELYAKIGDLANEGRARSNLAIDLRKLQRLDEARAAILRAIECDAPFGHASEPWKTWNILADIETAAQQPAAAAAAWGKARAAYLAHRRDGGGSHEPAAQLAEAVAGHLRAGQPAAALMAELRQLADDPKTHDSYKPYLQTLQALASGRRDPALAETEGLNYQQAAEILLLLEQLG